MPRFRNTMNSSPICFLRDKYISSGNAALSTLFMRESDTSMATMSLDNCFAFISEVGSAVRLRLWTLGAVSSESPRPYSTTHSRKGKNGSPQPRRLIDKDMRKTCYSGTVRQEMLIAIGCAFYIIFSSKNCVSLASTPIQSQSSNGTGN